VNSDEKLPVTVARTAAALIIGSELLSGKVREENLHALSGTLRAIGVELKRVIICPDESAIIAGDLQDLLAGHDVVFTSGGLGPTHDDVTVMGVCQALGVKAETSASMLFIIEKIYGKNTTDNHRLMATIPSGARLIDTGGWPLIVADRVWLLPGIPELFKSKLAEVRRHLRGPNPIHSKVLKISVEEAYVKQHLDQVVHRHSEVEIGSYPKWLHPEYKTAITLDSRSLSSLLLAYQELKGLVFEHLVNDEE